ncbi:amino acid adenylation domain-containing protein [Pedobacter aquatilis]|uniref:polyketide synthase n=1 Tax=Pedobacter aquatilis TaxID=351343 RepID=UPI0025B32C0B|nr:polyketide synthase [Pedobacter aquatilis]MDN3585372.1 amino acid adenylation domain-containing protein [Pedobacter aquatilis]
MSSNNTIINLFSEQAKKYPDRIALTFGDNTITYKQLNLKSDQFAEYLLANGASYGNIIPICINRSLEMVISIIAIMKCGCAYAPIDPNYPVDRINYIIEDCGSDFVVSNNDSSKKFKTKAVLVDDFFTINNRSSGSFSRESVIDTTLAYVIYTSGTTGRPKGVMVEHRSIYSYITNQSAYFGIKAEERIVQFSNYCFDASIEQIFLALTNGANLFIITEELLANIESFTSFLETNKITHLHATPGFIENIEPKAVTGLKRIVSAGDICKKELYRKWRNKVNFYNKYGPTETTISVLECLCSDDILTGSNSLPIGKPISGVTIYLLDENLNQVDNTQVGEIYVGGIQVTRGYLNKADLTSKNFIASPFDNNERLYKTGDLARQLEDGNIEFNGRIDDQVKIRGYRIELSEIENTLREAPNVKQSVVVVQHDEVAGKRLVAYIVPEEQYDKNDVLFHLRGKLPEYMIPQFFITLNSIPLTSNGKIDKGVLPIPDVTSLLANVFVAAESETEKTISTIWKSLLNVSSVGKTDNFFELGGNSLLAQKFIINLGELGKKLPVVKLYQHPTIEHIAAFLDGSIVKPNLIRRKKLSNTNDNEIAIIGMATRVPGADNVQEFWNNLINAKETVHYFSENELDISISAELKNDSRYVKARGIINEPKSFDPDFFGINPKLAALMDPQQRIFLEVAWEALEQCNHVPAKYEGSIGVYAGCRFNTYYTHNVLSNKELIENIGAFQVGTVSDKDYLATRTAYALNLNGPAVNIQSACSTSLLAVAQAVQSIRAGQCDVAIAGGSAMLVPINSGHIYQDGAMLSEDGHSRVFDESAAGTVFSDGAGVVILKSKSQAILDGDLIYAVVKGVGLSNDGSRKGSFTAPSSEGQANAILMAINDGAIAPSEITYIEAHGTATPLGDPIEIEGLNLAFGQQLKKQYCAIGSVKSNLGHLTAASGVIGLIKTALSIHHKQIPPSINYQKPNPNIDFENSPFYVNSTLKNWETQKKIAGVSSFGVGGTNVHVILEGFETKQSLSSVSRPVQLLAISAKNETSLNNYGISLAKYLTQGNRALLPDIAYTLNVFRHHFNYRKFVVADKDDGIVEQLSNLSVLSGLGKKITKSIKEVVFMFPGQGSQFLNMGKALYEHESVFKNAMDECNAILKLHINEDLLSIIYPEEITDAAENKLKNTRYSQPALFMLGYSLAKLWMSWGVYPSAFIGHSIGEFVAAYFSGILNLQDALKIISKRGFLMSELPEGSMLSVRAKLEDINDILPEKVSIAAINSADLLVLAGESSSISYFSKKLDGLNVANKLLQTSHAFHSYMMDDVVEPFKASFTELKLNNPLIPIYSTVTGHILSDDEATDASYWANHLRATVNFEKAAGRLIDDNSDKAFIEMGPGNATSTFIRQHRLGKNCTIISSLDFPKKEQTAHHSILSAVGNLWINGFDFNWKLFYQTESRAKVYDLPTYAFNKSEYWVEPVHFANLNTSIPNFQNIKTEQNKPLPIMRKQALIKQVKDILENASGFEMDNVTPDMTFIEIGLDSLLLTQVALILKKQFSLPITFRQLNEEFGTLDLLTNYLDANLPVDAVSVLGTPQQQNYSVQNNNQIAFNQTVSNNSVVNGSALDLIGQQLQLLGMQISLLQNNNQNQVVQNNAQVSATQPTKAIPTPSLKPTSDLTPEEEIEIKKPFGAAARIEKQSAALNDRQTKYLADLTTRYTEKTKASKNYTQEHRPHMADPRVVSGFKPATKELVYSIVINKSKGSRIWDIDGNEYIDALNGFGSNMLGYQPDFIKNALIDQIEKGYEIGPQHELAGEVSKLICEFTNFDRAGLCNTGSEAVLGAMRIARTVTGRSTIVAFTGSYHGIADEVIVRGSKKLKTFPAAPGILPSAVQNMLILDYGTEESLKIIEERANDIAAVLVEPIQSRRADFQPIDFLKKLRKITEDSETVLIFDEVISGFRFHPAGVQGLFGIQADLGTYGKVAGGGISIGIIAGKKKYMDALDGGFWQFGDDSIPEIGVTYFAGTFVRHPLALATAKASLNYLKKMGPQLQENLNANGTYVANTINALCRKLNVPMFVAQFGSLWRIKFIEEYPYTELFFTLMRLKGIHILEGFACFLTTAHSNSDIQLIIKCFEESLIELKEVGFIPEYKHPDVENAVVDLNHPPAPNARLGKDKDGNPAWFVKDETNPSKYLQVN